MRTRTELTPTRRTTQRVDRDSNSPEKSDGHLKKDSLPNENAGMQQQHPSRNNSASPFRRDASQQKTLTAASRHALSLSRSDSSPTPGSRHEHAIESDARDDVSVASQSSNASRRQSRRKAFLASAERTRSANEQGRKSSPAPKSRTGSPLEMEACDNGSVGSMSSNPSRRVLKGQMPANTHKHVRSTSPLVHSSELAPRENITANTYKHARSTSPLVHSSEVTPRKNNIVDMATNSIQPELNNKSERKIEIDMRLRDVIDPIAKATDEGIPKVRSMNVETSNSNLSETTQRVRNTKDKDRSRASPGARTATTSRVITSSRSAPRDAPAALSVSRERARMARYKERAESPSDVSLRFHRDEAPQVVFKSETRSNQRQDDNLSQSSSTQPTIQNEPSKPRLEATTKSKEINRSLATPMRLNKAEKYRQRDALRTESVSPKGSRRVDHPVFTDKSTPTSPRASPRNLTRSPRNNKLSIEMNVSSPATVSRNDCEGTVDSPTSSTTSTRLDAFEKANAKRRLHPVSNVPFSAKEYKKEAAIRMKTPSPKREKISTHRALRGSSPPTSPSQALIRDHHVKVLHAGPTSAVKSKATESSAIQTEVDDRASNRIGKVTSTSSAEKPLASRNPYLAHLQQKQNITHVPLVLSAAHHATSSTPANIALSLREVTPASNEKSASAREVTTNDGEGSDETSSDHDIYSLTKPSDDSMLAYSESEAGSAYSGLKVVANKNEGFSRLPGSLPENRCAVDVAPDLADNLLAPLHVKSPCDSVTHEGFNERLLESGTVSNTLKGKRPSSPNSSERFAKEAGLQLSAALQWWQANYAQNQDDNVNKLVEDALTRLSSTETSHMKAPTPQASVSQREFGKSCDGDGQSIATDEGSIFSGLDETTKGNSITSADEADVKADVEHQAPQSSSGPVHTPGAPNETSAKTRLPAPPPPAQKHVGEVLDEGELLKTVNSDITSSIIARSLAPSAMIKEEESVDVKEENGNDWSDKGGKSRSSHKTISSDRSTMGEKSKSSGTASESAGTSTATGQSGTKSKASRDKAKSSAPGRTMDERLSRDVFDADVSTEIPLFHCSGDGPRVESKESTIKAVFMKIGHSILDKFEIVCRGPGEYRLSWWANTFDVPTF